MYIRVCLCMNLHTCDFSVRGGQKRTSEAGVIGDCEAPPGLLGTELESSAGGACVAN